MREDKGDLWQWWQAGEWLAVTTNPIVRADGACVMGRGIAREAAIRFPRLPYRLGTALKREGNHVFVFEDLRLVSFPVKHHWRQDADPALIVQSAIELVVVANELKLERVYMPRPGCGNGRLSWTTVKPMLDAVLDDRFIAVTF